MPLEERREMSEAKPLCGKRVLITRRPEQASELARLLEAAGAEVFIMPTIKITGPASWAEGDRAIERLSDYDWLVFTSSNGVEHFCQRANLKGVPAGPRICAVGPATAKALAAHHWDAALIPERYTSEGVLAAFPERLEGVRVLLPRGNLARDTLPEGLRRRGAVVDEVTVYRTVMADPPDPAMLDRLRSDSIDVVTFTSSSTAKNFVRLVGQEDIERLKDRFLVASIGAKTSRTIRQVGLSVDIEAPTSTVSALVEALVTYYRGGK